RARAMIWPSLRRPPERAQPERPLRRANAVRSTACSLLPLAASRVGRAATIFGLRSIVENRGPSMDPKSGGFADAVHPGLPLLLGSHDRRGRLCEQRDAGLEAARACVVGCELSAELAPVDR